MTSRTRSWLREAFGARSAYKSAPLARTRSPRQRISEQLFFDRIEDAEYRAALEELFSKCHALGLKFEFGDQGPSIRWQTEQRPQPISIASFFPPGVTGWLGLKDVTLGFHQDYVRRRRCSCHA